VDPLEAATLTPVPNGGPLVVTEPSGAMHAVTRLREEPGAVAACDDAGLLLGRVLGLGSETPRIERLAAANQSPLRSAAGIPWAQ